MGALLDGAGTRQDARTQQHAQGGATQHCRLSSTEVEVSLLFSLGFHVLSIDAHIIYEVLCMYVCIDARIIYEVNICIYIYIYMYSFHAVVRNLFVEQSEVPCWAQT